MASDQETLSTSIEDYVLLQQKEQERIISEASHLLVDEDADDSAVDKIDVNSPSITASPHFYHNESKMMDPSQPLIHDRIPLNSSDDSHPFECSCSWFCRRNFLLKLFYLFLGVLAFCGLVVLADEIGVSTVETIRRYQHRTNHHTNPHQSHHSRQYPGPRYFRVPGEQQCHNEVAFYQNDEMERYGFACAVQWSYGMDIYFEYILCLQSNDSLQNVYDLNLFEICFEALLSVNSQLTVYWFQSDYLLCFSESETY